jgi:hypothetical protein
MLWLSLVFAALVAPPLLAVPEPSADELKANRVQLEQWRRDPEQMARVYRNLRGFLSLSEDRRDRVLKLDQDLQKDAQADRLVHVLERYAAWLSRLPEAERRQIENTPNINARLALVQDLRDREWMQTQPKASQDRWNALAGGAKTEFVHKLRQEDRKRREAWLISTHFWKRLQDGRPPTRWAELSGEDQVRVKEYLKPMLGTDEQKRLQAAEGQWPGYLVTVVELADHHPLALPGPDGPNTVKDLPEAIRRRLLSERIRLKSGSEIPAINIVRPGQKGNWKPLAQSVVVCYREYLKNDILPNELWAYNERCLLKPMRDYVAELNKVLTPAEKERLQKATNQWPEYPTTIQTLAKAHEMPPPPWNTALSGPRESWDDCRTWRDKGAVAVSWHELQDFALTTLPPDKVARIKMMPEHQQFRFLADEWRKHVAQFAQHGPAKMQHFDLKSKGRRPAPGHDRR